MAPYFQPVVDLIAAHPPPNGSLDRVLALCQAVDAEDGPRVTIATAGVVADVNPRMSPPVLIPETVWHETFVRMLFLGEHSDLERLLEWYERPIAFASMRRELVSLNWQGMFESIRTPAAGLSEVDRGRQLARIVTALTLVVRVHDAADKEDNPQPPAGQPPAKPPVYEYSPGESPPGSFGSGRSGPPKRSEVLADGVRRLMLAWMEVHQQAFDAAWTQLGSGGPDRAKALLTLRDQWRAAAARTFGRFPNSAGWPKVQIPIATIRYGRSPHHEYLDAFLPHDARAFGFKPYDREPQDEPPGKTGWLTDLLRYRGNQLHFQLDAFGEYYPPDPPPKTASEQKQDLRRKLTQTARRKVIDHVERAGGPLRLESEDDLVKFGCAFHRAILGASASQPSPADRRQAWETFLDLLRDHLRTQTFHTEFNLDEDKSYFGRLFPRAINGGAWHDCGVYAVRLAFVFLSLADCLRSAEYPNPPQVSFIMFPLHVGLIIELDGFPPFVVHNEILFRLTEEQLKEARAEWDSQPEADDPTDPAALDRKFLEDIAATQFLRDVDMPLRRERIRPVSAPPSKAQLTRAYERLVVKRIDRLFTKDVNIAGRDAYQFDLRFLGALTEEKRWHDRIVVPFWNGACFPLWAKHKSVLQRSNPTKVPYEKALEQQVQDVDATYDLEIRTMKDRLTKELRDNEKRLKGDMAQRITVSSRLKGFAKFQGPVGQVREHIDTVKNAMGPIPEPPFARDEDKLPRYNE